MKRTLYVFLAVCIMVTSFVGCAQKTGSNVEEKLKTITIWTHNSHSKPFYDEKTEEFNKTIGKEMGIKVEYVVKENNTQAVEIAFTSDQAPDFMSGNVQKLAGEDKIIAFNDMKNGKKYIDKYKDYSKINRNIVDGKMYAAPQALTTYGLIYNKDMFKAAGIVDENGEAKPPKTYQEMVEYAKKLTNREKKQYGLIFEGNEKLAYASLVNERAAASGGQVGGFISKTAQYDYTVQGEIMKTLVQIKKDGSYVPGCETINNDAARARFAAGNIGMKMSGSYDYAVFTQQFPIKDFEWGVAPCPVLDADDRHYEYAFPGSNLLINKKSYEKYGEDVILAVYDFYSNDDFIIDLYKGGYNLPYTFDIIKDVKLDGKEQWQQFADIINISATGTNVKKGIENQNPAQCDTTGIEPLADTWAKLWTEQISTLQLDAIIKQYTSDMNNGIKKYSAAHPDYKQPVPDPEWDSKIYHR